jgi:hypothetical protein
MSGTAGPAHMFPDRETTQYQVAIPAEDWEAWKRTVPRTIPLYKRLYQLIREDTIPEDQMDDANLSLIMLKFQRVAQRVENAETALDDGDPERARDELAAIRDIAAEVRA